MIREQDPLKQGLKPVNSSAYGPFGKIREQDPLKQGLKLVCRMRYLDVAVFASKIH